MGLDGGLGGRGRHHVHAGESGDRQHLGPRRMGHLVGMGRAHDHSAHAVPAVPGVPADGPAITEPTQRGTMSAILAIFAAADIPIVTMAIRLHNVRTQHPGPVLETGGLAPVYWPPFLIGIISFMLLGTAMMLVRLHQESNRREIDSLRREIHAI